MEYRNVFSEMFEGELEGYYRFNNLYYNNRFSYAGQNADGIDVFVTDNSLKGKFFIEKRKIFLNIMKKQYRGRTARFTRNGHTYYAKFSNDDVRKNTHGDTDSDSKGLNAKINLGASGDIFDLFESMEYDKFSFDRGNKPGKAHKDLYGWYYFVKTVQIDNVIYNVIANVRLGKDGQYLYFIELHEDKNKKASPPLQVNGKPFLLKSGAQRSSNSSLPRIDEFDNTNINENDIGDLGNINNSVSSNINTRARRIFTQGRLQYGLEPDVVYGDDVSLTISPSLIIVKHIVGNIPQQILAIDK